VLDEVRSAVALLNEAVRDFDPRCVDGERAVELTELFARAEKTAGAGKALAAQRAAETGAWARSSHAASGDQWLALVSGASESSARQTLVTAERLALLPDTAAAVRSGDVSMAQAAQVTAGATVDPDAEAQLLRSAKKDGMRELRKKTDRVIAGATDEAAARSQAVRERHMRTWRKGAATCASISGPSEDMKILLDAMEPLEKEVFARARENKQRESSDAYSFDALIELARRALDGTPTAAGTRARSVVRARVDLGALRRGHTETGEICEIPGVGPVAVSHARQILGDDGLLELLITDGVDVQTVVSRTRHVPDALKVAIDERDQVCKVDGCDIDHNLERHHVLEFADHQLTTYEILGKLCPVHHDLVTHRGYTIEVDPDGTWRLRAPPEEDAA